MCRMRYRTTLLFCIYLCFLNVGNTMPSWPPQTDPCDQASLSSATAFYCQFSHRDSLLDKFPTYRYMGAVEVYLRINLSPYTISLTPQSFIEQLAERNRQFLIRNGGLPKLKKAFCDYQEELRKLKQLTAALGVPLEATKKDFSQLRAEQLCDWSLIRQMRKTLWKSFRRFKSVLSITYETEITLLAQYIHNPGLFEAVNNLVNLDGSSLPVYVYARPAFFGSSSSLPHLAGIVIMSQQEGLFSSDTPAIRSEYPGLVGHEGALTVFVGVQAPGLTLSHEFGHLHYLYHHWEDYTDYMKEMGRRYQVGGHGAGDPSGLAAELAEKGKLPDLHMPWTYRPAWKTTSHDIPAIAQGAEE